jgi:hypothetical protein
MHHALGQALLDEAIALQVLFGRAFPSKLLLVTAPNGCLAPYLRLQKCLFTQSSVARHGLSLVITANYPDLKTSV